MFLYKTVVCEKYGLYWYLKKLFCYRIMNIISERTVRLKGYGMPINIIIDNSVIELYI